MGRKSGQWISRRSWTTEDEKLLRQLAETVTKDKAAKALNRSITAIGGKMHKLGLKFEHKMYRTGDVNRVVRCWTKIEQRKLLGFAGIMTIETAAKKLGRTRFAVTNELQRMNVPWSCREHTKKDVAEILGVAETTVSRYRTKLYQIWRHITEGRYTVMRGATDADIQEIARYMLDTRAPVGASYKRLEAVARGEW